MNLYSITVGFARSGVSVVTSVFPRAGRPARVTHAVPVALRAGSAGQRDGQGVRRASPGSGQGRRPPDRLHLARTALHGHRGAGVLAGQPDLVAGVRPGTRATRAQVLAGRGGQAWRLPPWGPAR